MNGVPPVWQSATHDDGRIYYYNTITKQTQWTKPEEIMTDFDKALAASNWKEFTAEGGKKYFHNDTTGETTWTVPPEFEGISNQVAGPPSRPAAPQFVSGGATNYQDNYQPRQHRDRDDNYRPSDRNDRNDRQSGYGAAMPSSDEPDYASIEEAEAVFFKLLKRSSIEADSTWEDTIRAAAKDKDWRAIKDPKDRKAAYEKYITDVRAQEKEREKERQAKLRSDFTSMLRTHPEITYYTRWRTAKPIIEGETLYRTAKNDEERMTLFNEYRNDLYKAHLEEDAANRKSALEDLHEILDSLDLEPYARWADTQKMIQANEQFQGDEKFESIPKIEILKTFETHVRSLERSFNERRQKEKNVKHRTERQRRDQFINLLEGLRNSKQWKLGMKWKDLRPIIEKDPRYVQMLGQEGSTPLDLFWDQIEKDEELLRKKRNDVLDVLDDKRYELTTKTTIDEFMSVMQTDRRTKNLEPEALSLIFERLHQKVVRRSEEDKHQAERHQRRAVEDLRSKIKRLSPAVVASDSWEQVRSRVEKLEEYRVLDSDELARSAFDKVIRRLKEKSEEHGKDRRDRDRNGDGKRLRTRTPEMDAYEADRRKAQAARERNYGKRGASGLSPPPPRARDRDDRYDGRKVSTHYERERRDRESERERSYTSRADPRDRTSELDYGDSRPGSIRRRRESDVSVRDVRDNKRPRRDRLSRERSPSHSHRQSRTPQPTIKTEPPKEDPGLRSGSEEGEIEED